MSRAAEEIRDLFPALVVMECLKPAQAPRESVPAQGGVAEPSFSKLGDYRIVRELGRGGMGIVYEAVQESLGRQVALKVLPKQFVDSAARQGRFEREARSAARLHHSNIVPVFGVGCESGLHYYAMQYINGLGMDAVLRELKRLRSPSQTPVPMEGANAEPPPPLGSMSVTVTQALLSGQFDTGRAADAGDDLTATATPTPVARAAPGKVGSSGPTLSGTAHARLSDTAHSSNSFSLPGQKHAGPGAARTTLCQSIARIGIQVGGALHYAHEQGVLHRDIKPSNLLLDTRGTVWVTDFGLAKSDDQRDLTQAGDVLGTLRYMAPEMFHGQADRRSDVYSLGLTLYELLALRPAFHEADRGRLIRLVLNEAPPRLRTLDPAIPRDLETIVHKAIEREPANRYASAQELADDLNRFLNDEPIRARHVSLATRFTRWCKRNPAVAALTSTIALLLLGAAVSSTIAAVYFQLMVKERGIALAAATTAKIVAQQEKTDADLARDRAERQRDRANTNYARARRAVDSYLSKVTEEELLSVPGLQPLRQQLLAEALKFYSEFIQEGGDDPQLQIELASAHYRLGIIHRDLGNSSAAEAANAEAIRLLESLRNKIPGGNDVLAALAEAYFFAKRYDDAIALCQLVLKTRPNDVLVRSTLAETYNTLAINKKEGRDIVAALKYHQQALEIRQKLVEEFPNEAKHNAELASTLNNIGVLHGGQGKPVEALAMYQLAVTYDEKVCRLAPHSVLWGRWQATGYGNIGHTQRQLGQPQEALQAFQRQADVWDRLVTQNRALTYLRCNYYKALLLLADQQKLLGLTNEASRSTRDAREVLARLQGSAPAELFELATVYASLAAPPDPNLEAAADTPDAADERQRNADLAMQTLDKAVKAGWADSAALKSKVLDPIRQRKEFPALAVTIDSVAVANRALSAEAKTPEERIRNLGTAEASLKDIHFQRATRAFALRSVGVLHSDLKQYAQAERALNEALQLYEQLRREQPEDPSATSRCLATRILIGQLEWDQRKYSEAHRRWKSCLAETLQLASAQRQNTVLLQSLGDVERTIFERYGAYGLFPLLREFVARQVEFRRVQALDSGGIVTDGEFSAVVLGLNDADLAARFFRQFEEAVAASADPSLKFEVIHLTRGQAALGDAARVSADALTRTRKALAENKRNAWVAAAVAMAQYRAGQYQQAQATLAPVRDSDPQVAFLDAAIAWQLGDHSRSKERWAVAEARYRQICTSALDQDGIDSKTGIFRQHWWQFSFGQAMRRLAGEVIFGKQPGDPWQHLILARGYRLIGEHELAEKELAAAASTAPQDSQIWIARARLLESWGEPQRGEADWRRAVELAGPDPAPWIDLGRWHAQHGDHNQADADFARAAALTNQLNPFLEAGWWVVAPVAIPPDKFDQPQAPEIHPDPSRSVPVPQGWPELTWRPVNSGDFGYIDFAEAGKPDLQYALGYPFSPSERKETLVLSGHGNARVWLNGQEIGRLNDSGGSEFAPYQRLSVPLQKGRNTILVKHWPGQTTGGVYLRFAEGDPDRGISYLEAGLTREAAELLERGLQRPPAISAWPWQAAVKAFRGAGISGDRYQRLVDRLVARFGDSSNVQGAAEISLAGGLTPEALIPSDKLVERATAYHAADPKNMHRNMVLALAHYRAGKFQEALDRLLNDNLAERYQLCWPLAALCCEQLGDRAASRRWLGRAADYREKMLITWRPAPRKSLRFGTNYASC